jgi:hypothetical protein
MTAIRLTRAEFNKGPMTMTGNAGKRVKKRRPENICPF